MHTTIIWLGVNFVNIPKFKNWNLIYIGKIDINSKSVIFGGYVAKVAQSQGVLGVQRYWGDEIVMRLRIRLSEGF